MIIKNAIKCVGCGKEIESHSVADLIGHNCISIYFRYIHVDGGKERLRRYGRKTDYIETSITREG